MNQDDKVEELRKKVGNLRDELRAHGEITDDPKCAALCETSAEVLGGLELAFDHFLERSEKAWQDI
jgi:hypothetical protein